MEGGKKPLDVRDLKGTRIERIYRERKTHCHGIPPLLVRIKVGGFIKWRCPECRNTWELGESEFLSLPHQERCPECGKEMAPGRLPYSTYGYVCDNSQVGTRIGDVIPDNDEL